MNNNPRDEQLFAYKVAHRLDHSAQTLDALTLNKLMMARQDALSRQRTAVAGLRLAGLERIAVVLMPQARTLLALLALAIGAMGTYYWDGSQLAEENEEIDSALLADDIPINVYLDRGFHAWLETPVSSDSEPSSEE